MAPERRGPNLVFIFADQMRAQATGYAGDPNVQTPSLDRLRDQSVSFSTAVSNCPICTPYRACLLTGQYPLTTGLFMNDLCLSDRATSLAQAYGAAGYDTAYVGKWHLDGHGRSRPIPPERRQGFEYWKVLECTHDYNHSGYYAGDSKQMCHWEGYDAEAQTDDAIEYLRRRDGRDAPFALVLSFGPPHNPYPTAPEEFQRLYEPADLQLRDNVAADCRERARADLAGYYAHISALDRCVGRVAAALNELGLEEDTILVFTSDHGDSVWSQCDAEVGNINKQRPYDESIRVPFLLRWPGGLGTSPRTVTAPIATPDIMPTLLELAGLPIPDTVEGLSYAADLAAGRQPQREAVLIAAYSTFSDWRPSRGGREYRGVRTERYTYAQSLEGPWLLFDNQADPLQQSNLVGLPEHTAAQRQLVGALEAILREQGDDFPTAEALRARYGYRVDSDSGAIPYTN